MKRLLRGSFITLIILILLAIGYSYYKKNSFLKSDPLDAVPADGAIVLRIQDFTKTIHDLEKLAFWKNFSSDSSFRQLTIKLALVDSFLRRDEETANKFKAQPVYFSIHPTKASDFDFLILTSLPSGFDERDMVKLVESFAGEVERREYEDVNIYEVGKAPEPLFTFAISEGVCIGSATSFLVEDGIRQLRAGLPVRKSKAFVKARPGERSTSPISIYINHLGLAELLSGYVNSDQTPVFTMINNLARWTNVSAEVSNSQIELMGKSAASDSLSLVGTLSAGPNGQSRLANYLPQRTAFYLSFNPQDLPATLKHMEYFGSYFDPASIRKAMVDSLNRKFRVRLDQGLTSWIKNELAYVITEPAGTSFENNTYAFIRSDNSDKALTTLRLLQHSMNPNGISDKYKGYQVNELCRFNVLSLFYGNFFKSFTRNYYTKAGDYIVFANQAGALKNLIDDLTDKKILAKDSSYKNMESRTGTISGLSVYSNFARSINLLKAGANEEFFASIPLHSRIWNNLSSLLIRWRNDKTEMNVHGVLQFAHVNSSEARIVCSAQLDTSAVSPPCVIEGNDPDEFYIAEQDANNTLYFINNGGNILWKKILPERIMGSIHTVDYYRNGEKQLMFNTTSALYLIDVKGDSTGTYPIRLPAPAVTGSLLIDLNNSGRQQILVGCANGIIYAYELGGQPVSSWLFSHFISGLQGKLYTLNIHDQPAIVLRGAKQVFTCDRQGRIRGVVNLPMMNEVIPCILDTSQKIVYLCLDNSGMLNMFSGDGKRKETSWSENKKVTAVRLSKSMNSQFPVINFISEDSVFSYDPEMAVPCSFPLPGSGNYKLISEESETPSVYTGIVSENENNFYLINPKCGVMNGFPVRGTTSFRIMGRNTAAAKKKLVIGSSDGSLYVYAFE